MFEKELLKQQKSYFSKGNTLETPYRLSCLEKLGEAIRRHEADIISALRKDFGKCAFDTYSTEIYQVLQEIDAFRRHLRRWSRPERVSPGIVHFPARGRIYRQPYGSVLIVSPWNYPFMLAMTPLVGAVAAGNCAVVKPSAQTPHTAAVIAAIIDEVFLPEHVSVLQGGHEVSDALLALPFDLIFFTGSARVGRRVMEKAAVHLTPVVLELGGKSPCIVDGTADLEKAAKRIVWGKFLNAGQTCVAPDYLLVEQSAEAELLSHLKRYIEQFYYCDGSLSEEYPQIINERHWQRLAALLGEGELVCGGDTDAESRRIAPTVLRDVAPDSILMQEEIFGPILPVLTYDSIDEAIAFVNSRPKPLALYYFSRDKKDIRRVLERTSSGGGCVNNVVMHVASERLPFGGVGESGMGLYHGRYSLDTFSNQRSILHQSAKYDVGLKYPPHGSDKIKKMKKLLFLK